MDHDDRVIALLRQLVEIDSQNPPGNERAIAEFVRAFLGRLKVPCRFIEYRKDRTNVLASLKGTGRKSLLITPHLDTVPAGKSWKMPPLAGTVRAGRLYGLGTTDCKCNLAVSLEVIRRLVEDKVRLPYTLIFAATADEETGSDQGIVPLLRRKVLSPDAAVVLDADDFSIVVAQKGLLHVKVKVRGKKAHGAYPERGINAISAATRILSDLQRIRPAASKCKYLKPATMNPGTIHGGDKVNVVADWCEMELDFRYLPGERAKDILKTLRGICRRHARKFSLEVDGVQMPYLISEGHPLVAGLTRAMKAHGVAPVLSGSEGATVITFFQDRKIPAVATGFGSEGCAHIADEYVRLRNLRKGVAVLETFLREYRF